MALDVVEKAGKSDVGMQRQTNEDNLVLASPFFAVADGMGGAKAGEVASQLAAETFEGEGQTEEPPEEQLRRIVQEANRRIFDLANRDESRRGMGTTLTAAKFHDDQVSIGHVGDSRAYLMRRGGLEQLTKDHSLVAELERTGQITREAAEHHPQRSIITRALGPEPDVEVDTFTVPGKDGDVYLLCSDGLTSMLSDEDVSAIVRGGSSLEGTAEELVSAANQRGGKDNITVVLFRLAGDGGEEEEHGTLSGSETVVGQFTADDVRAAASEPQAGVTTITRPPRTPRREHDPTPIPRSMRPTGPPPKEGRARRVLGVLAALLAVAAVLAGLYVATRQVYFVGTNDGGLVTLYRGVPYELPLGLDLYEEEYASSVPAQGIPRARRARVLDHEWRDKEDATDLVRALERGRLEPVRSGR